MNKESNLLETNVKQRPDLSLVGTMRLIAKDPYFLCKYSCLCLMIPFVMLC